LKIRRDKLDTLFSIFIRLRAGGKCEYCGGASDRLECSHFHGRRKIATRFDPDNAAGLCFSCHSYLGEHPNKHAAFFITRLGSERYEALNIRAEIVKVKIDREALEAELKEKIKLLEG
jgi:hypothetical protein